MKTLTAILIASFLVASSCHATEVLVTMDEVPIVSTDTQGHKYFALPVQLISGSESTLFYRPYCTTPIEQFLRLTREEKISIYNCFQEAWSAEDKCLDYFTVQRTSTDLTLTCTDTNAFTKEARRVSDKAASAVQKIPR